MKQPSWLEVVGAPSYWDVLNDDLTEAQTPSTGDYLAVSPGGPRSFEVEMDSTAITASKIIAATAWIYTPSADEFEVRVTNGPAAVAGPVAINSTGWHEIPIVLSGSQNQLDNLRIRFSTGPFSGAKRKVSAALIKLVLEGSPPSAYWGAWMSGKVYHKENPLLTDAPWNSETWNKFEQHARKSVSIVHFGEQSPWEYSFSSEPLIKSRERGALPLMDMGIGYKPGIPPKSNETHAEEEEHKVSLAEINEGRYDADYKAWAEAAAAYSYPFFFRWAWEMNGTWWQFNRQANANPAAFVAAWRRIYGIFKAAGASNVTWVWCPNVIASAEQTATLEAMYPGNEYVDWTCLDGYNFGGSSFSSVIGTSYSALLQFAPSKPIMIGETASVESYGLKGPWITDALVNQLPVAYPKVKAVVWFNWNIAETGTERTWPIESSDSSQVGFAAAIGSPYYASNTFGGLLPGTKIQPLP